MSAEALSQWAQGASAPAPEGPARASSSQRIAARRDMHAPPPKSEGNINDGHRLVFRALTSGLSDEFAMMSCFVNDAPTAMIVAARQHGEHVEIMPLFVAITPGMRITDHDGDVLWDGGVA